MKLYDAFLAADDTFIDDYEVGSFTKLEDGRIEVYSFDAEFMGLFEDVDVTLEDGEAYVHADCSGTDEVSGIVTVKFMVSVPLTETLAATLNG